MSEIIKVIDLFAGPGGLGEGFSAFESPGGRHPFKIAASVEKEASAHKTLTLRAFFRKFLGRKVPKAYYDYLRLSRNVNAEQFFSEKYAREWNAAKRETLGGPKALGSEDHDEIFAAIQEALISHTGPKVVIGGPPCQAYSLVGRARNKGVKGYSAEKDERHFLYQEYLKVLDLVQPEVFVMENVKGILSAKVNSELIFPKIRDDLRCPALAVKSGNRQVKYELFPLAHPLPGHATGEKIQDGDFLIKAEQFGIPQARHRVIILGVQEGLLKTKDQRALLSKWKTDSYVLPEQVLDDLPPLRSGLTNRKPNSFDTWRENFDEAYLSSIGALGEHSAYARQIADEAGNSRRVDHGQGGRFVRFRGPLAKKMPKTLQDWYLDHNIEGINNHNTRNHMAEDLHRYFFASCYAAASDGRSPRSSEYPANLAPLHKSWKSGNFADRFKVQARGRIASTVTSHISKDGHYFIHYDPSQCRSLTVREAARIQTFPDNYFFEGSRTEQYVQVGNAVPPLLANYIAEVVFSILEKGDIPREDQRYYPPDSEISSA